jgi:hypothetical protein
MVSFVRPECAEVHRHPLVAAMGDTCSLAFDRRDSLNEPYKDIHGKVLLPAMPWLLDRPGLRDGDGNPRQLSKARADWLQNFFSLWLVIISNASYRSKAILSPHHASRGAEPFMSLREMEHLAGLGGYAPSQRWRPLTEMPEIEIKVKFDDAGDCVERATWFMRKAGLLFETKQNREELPDGRHRATGAGVRRIVWASLYKWFGHRVANIARKVQQGVTAKLKKDLAARAAADETFRQALEQEENRRALFEKFDDGAELDAPEPAPHAPGAPDPTILDDVHEAHPDWTIAQLNDEARRIELAIAADLHPPDVDSS